MDLTDWNYGVLIGALALAITTFVGLRRYWHMKRGTLRVWMWIDTHQSVAHPMLLVRAVNRSYRNTTVNGVAVEAKDETHHIPISALFLQSQDPHLPTKLEPHAQWTGALLTPPLVSALRDATGHDAPWRIRASIRDVEDREHLSAWFAFDPDKPPRT